MIAQWKHPTPELPTLFDRLEYQARRCKGAWWHPSLLLNAGQVAALRAALETEEGQAWLKAKGEREAVLVRALLGAFMKHSLEDPRPVIERPSVNASEGAPPAVPEPTIPYFVSRPNETARQRYERQAQEWYMAGRPDELLVDSYRLVALRCWIISDGGKQEPISTFLRDFAEESDVSLPLSYSWTLGDHGSCRACGETYRVENLMLCTHCPSLWCHRCICFGKTPKRPNGNPACRCTMGELVG